MMQVLFNFQQLEVNKNNLEMHLWKEKNVHLVACVNTSSKRIFVNF